MTYREKLQYILSLGPLTAIKQLFPFSMHEEMGKAHKARPWINAHPDKLTQDELVAQFEQL